MIYKCVLIPLITQGCIICNVFKLCLHQYVPIGFFKPKPKTIFVFDVWLPYFFCIGVGQYVYSLCLNTANNIILIMIAMFFIYKIQTWQPILLHFLVDKKKINYISFLISIKCFYLNCIYWPCAIQHGVRTSGTGKMFDAKIVN